MSIYFVFSDECGKYVEKPSIKQLSAHPYYARSTFLMLGEEWKDLNNEVNSIKSKYEISFQEEFKWSFLWSLKKYKQDKKKITRNLPFYPYRDRDLEELMKYVKEVTGCLGMLSKKKALFTVTDNSIKSRFREEQIEKMHLQETMQRIEMEIQNSESNLAVLFIDPISEKKNEVLRNAYSQIFHQGDFIEDYSHIKDSLNFEYSHQSVGIQLADFIAGAFNSALKGWEFGSKLFCNQVLPIMRKSPRGRIRGYGLREVPSNNEIRGKILVALRDSHQKYRQKKTGTG